MSEMERALLLLLLAPALACARDVTGECSIVIHAVVNYWTAVILVTAQIAQW